LRLEALQSSEPRFKEASNQLPARALDVGRRDSGTGGLSPGKTSVSARWTWDYWDSWDFPFLFSIFDSSFATTDTP
jgi:hypothetical protein